MTESTIKQIQKEARQKERNIWYQELIKLNNDLVFVNDKDFRDKTFEAINKLIWKMRKAKSEDLDRISILRSQLASAGDRRDWNECERIEKELEKYEEMS